MSFILEALRKSEEDRRRQEHSEPDLTAPLRIPGGRKSSKALLLLTLALLINAGVLAAWLMRPGPEPGGEALTLPEPRPPEPAPFLLPEPAASVQPAESRAAPPAQADWSTRPVRSLGSLPAAERRRFDVLNISTHIYAEDPAFREVSINGRVYREGGRIDGMTLVTITESGIELGVGNEVIAVDLQDQWDIR
ncbi:MAG: hypothetical protein EA417_05345 [Gammaproteobacteria bacterium]|nr:MAG: hypothetical protein EA417_05345 [Gammaproteobacteria bacterium]